jgi:hypothetical protein
MVRTGGGYDVEPNTLLRRDRHDGDDDDDDERMAAFCHVYQL